MANYTDANGSIFIFCYLEMHGEATRLSNASSVVPPSSLSSVMLTKGWLRGTCKEYLIIINCCSTVHVCCLYVFNCSNVLNGSVVVGDYCRSFHRLSNYFTQTFVIKLNFKKSILNITAYHIQRYRFIIF